MAATVTFAQLPEEESAFLDYLQKTGDVWARAEVDDGEQPRFEPMPVRRFLERFSADIRQYDSTSVYIGMQDDVVHPTTHRYQENTIRETGVALMPSNVISYSRGEFAPDGQLVHTTLCYYTSYVADNEWVEKPAAFLKWAKNVLAWVRRHSPETVPLACANYSIRATEKAAAAHRDGLKIRY